MYSEDFVGIYDAVYRSHLDYPHRAKGIETFARTHNPNARTLLDVACGTGEHLRYLRDEFEVCGIDLAEPMVEVARSKLPDVPIHHADMRTFDLGGTYDVVTCMYSSVGYLPTLEDLFAAVLSMAKHVTPGGILIVEPWIFRERWNGGDLVSATFQSDDRTVTRMGKWSTRGIHSVVEMHYLIGDSAGVRHIVDHQELTLFTRQEYEDAFAAAGCPARFHPDDGFGGRGLFTAVRPR